VPSTVLILGVAQTYNYFICLFGFKHASSFFLHDIYFFILRQKHFTLSAPRDVKIVTINYLHNDFLEFCILIIIFFLLMGIEY